MTTVRTTKPLTERQAAALAFIRDHVAAHGRPPTNRDVARAIGSPHPNGGRQVVMALVAKGALEHQPGRACGIRLAGADDELARVRAENAALRLQVRALAERVAAQAEILERRSENPTE